MSYAIAAQAAWSLYGAAAIGASFFPAAGITVGAMLILPTRRWPAIVAAIVVAETAIDLLNGVSLGVALLYTAANAAEPLVGAVVVRRITGRSEPPFVDVSRPAGFAAFAGGALAAGPLVGAMLGAIPRAADAGGTFVSNLWSWWVGDALGVLAVGTALVLLVNEDVRARLRAGSTRRVIVVAAVAAVATLQIHLLTPYLVVPILMLVALFTGSAGAAVVGLVAALVANLATALGAGAFAAVEGITHQEQLVDTQLLVGASLIAAYLLAIEVGERERADAQRRLEHEARVRAESIQAVGALSRDLSLARDLPGVVAAVSAHLREHLGPAEVGLNVLDADAGRFHSVVAGDGSGAVVADAESLLLDDPFPGADAVRTGVARFLSSSEEIRARYPAAAPYAAEVGMAALAAIPLNGHDGPVGYLGLTWLVPHGFEEDERIYLGSVADVVGQAIERTRLMQRDHELAVDLQRAMLGRPDDVEGVTLATAYRPADGTVEIGGDWYDAIGLPDGRTAFVVGDVVGHSLDAAKAMGQVRSAIRTLAPLFPEPDELLTRLEPFVEETDGASPTTLVYGLLDTSIDRFRYASAGHVPPLLVPTHGDPAFLLDGRGAPLGARASLPWTVGEAGLGPGDTLILYTDGLVERRRESIDDGLSRLAARAAEHASSDPDTLTARLLDLLDRAEDDVALLVVRPSRTSLNLRIDADPKALASLRVDVRRWLRAHAIDDVDANDVLVAIGEAASNAVEHAYVGLARGEVRIEGEITPDVATTEAVVAVAIRDRGRWRAPAARGNRGRGEALMRTFIDDVRTSTGAGGTTVRLRRRVRVAAAAAAVPSSDGTAT